MSKVRRKPAHWSYAKHFNAAKAVYNAMVRAESADSRGMVRCVTCSPQRDIPWSDPGTHAGHWRPGQSVAFVRQNVHVQCYPCNEIFSSNAEIYARFMKRTYGPAVMDAIRAMEHEERPSVHRLLCIEAAAKDMLRVICEWKGLKCPL